MFFDFMSAGIWGFLGSFPLVIGAILGYYFNSSKQISSSLMVFSAGILSSAVCFEILFEAYHYGGLLPTVIGFIIGVIIFTLMDITINHLNKKQEKNNLNIKNDSKLANSLNSYFKIKINSFSNYKSKKSYNKYQVRSLVTITSVFLEEIPEAIAIGLILISGGPISFALIASISISNLFEGFSSANNMKLGKWTLKSIISLWGFITILSSASAMLSYIILSNTDQHILALALGMSAGAIISMIADIILPESFKETREFTGIIMSLGFLASFILSHLT